jgi:predicted nucleic acid-binding protein
MPFVLDTSIAMSWCFSDEATPATWRLLDSLRDDLAHIPAIWPLEVANALNMAQRRGRLQPNEYLRFLEIVRQLPIAVDQLTIERTLTVVLGLASSQQLTTYDAAYLELAVRLGVPLATKDTRLRRAAGRLGLSVLP